MNGENQFVIDNRIVTVYPSAAANRPVVYLNTFAADDGGVYQKLRDSGCPDFTLVVVGKLEWDHDMAPWAIPPISKNDTPCTGGADAYLKLLLNEIMPQAERSVQGVPLWRGLAGYSLAGLFALYAPYQTDRFGRVASMSGSLWFPGFKEYVFSHEMKRRPERLYMSLGDRECRTRNPYLKTVQEHTEAIHAFYAGQGIDTVLQFNPGNHYKDAVERTAAGIAWLLAG